MTTQQAVEFLRRYQQWRTGKIEVWGGDGRGPDPREVTQAIDVVCSALEAQQPAAVPEGYDPLQTDVLSEIDELLQYVNPQGETRAVVEMARERICKLAGVIDMLMECRPSAPADDVVRDAAVGAAIERAANELPRYYSIEIEVEQGAATSGCTTTNAVGLTMIQTAKRLPVRSTRQPTPPSPPARNPARRRGCDGNSERFCCRHLQRL